MRTAGVRTYYFFSITLTTLCFARYSHLAGGVQQLPTSLYD